MTATRVTLSTIDPPAAPGTDLDTWRHRTVLDGVDTLVATGQDATIWFDRVRYGIADLDLHSRRLAAWLAGIIEPGDRVGVMARNSPLALLTWWACARAGAIVVPYNTGNRGPILAHQLEDSTPRILFCQNEFLAELSAAAAALGPSVTDVVTESPIGPEPADSPAWHPSTTMHHFDEVLRSHPPAPAFRPDPRSTSHLVYTSGTTGPSKACVVSHGYIANFSVMIAQNMSRRPSDTMWTALPLFHLGAITQVTATVFLGSRLDLASTFSVSRFWEDVEAADARMAALIGSMIVLIANAPECAAARRFHGRLSAVSGSPVTVELADRWRKRFGVERVGAGVYGMTEAAPITTTPLGGYRPGTAGRASDSFEVRVIDEAGQPVSAGLVGEIVARPTRPGVMFDGYWGLPEQTLTAFRDLWFHTGDLGRLDEDGYLHFVDRGKDYLRRGGENISSFEVEAVLATHSQVGEVAVTAVRSDLSEDEVKATIVARGTEPVDYAALHVWCRANLPKYAVPRFLEVRESLPRNAVGRILKHLLRDEGVTADTWVAP